MTKQKFFTLAEISGFGLSRVTKCAQYFCTTYKICQRTRFFTEMSNVRGTFYPLFDNYYLMYIFTYFATFFFFCFRITSCFMYSMWCTLIWSKETQKVSEMVPRKFINWTSLATFGINTFTSCTSGSAITDAFSRIAR